MSDNSVIQEVPLDFADWADRPPVVRWEDLTEDQRRYVKEHRPDLVSPGPEESP